MCAGLCPSVHMQSGRSCHVCVQVSLCPSVHMQSGRSCHVCVQVSFCSVCACVCPSVRL